MKTFMIACLGVVVALGLAVGTARAETPESKAALADIQRTLGFVPTFFQAFPEEGIAGAWAEFKAIQGDPKTAVPGKYKELMGLAVSAQIPCEYCIYFHTRAAKANGATEREIKEAVAVAAMVRHWSTFLNGARIDEARFNKDLDRVVTNARKSAGKAAPPSTPVTDATSARTDVQRTLGFVPDFLVRFPDAAIAGAWTELKSLQLNPQTAIPSKYKELIGLAVAAQIPCRYCIAFHTEISTQLLGASDTEVAETLAMASLVRHWSTFLNGMQIDKATFRQEVDRLMDGGDKSAKK